MSVWKGQHQNPGHMMHQGQQWYPSTRVRPNISSPGCPPTPQHHLTWLSFITWSSPRCWVHGLASKDGDGNPASCDSERVATWCRVSQPALDCDQSVQTRSTPTLKRYSALKSQDLGASVLETYWNRLCVPFPPPSPPPRIATIRKPHSCFLPDPRIS